MTVPKTVEKNARGEITHDCRALGCEIAFNGIALVDVEVYLQDGQVLFTVPAGMPMPTRDKLTTLTRKDRPFTRRKVA